MQCIGVILDVDESLRLTVLTYVANAYISALQDSAFKPVDVVAFVRFLRGCHAPKVKGDPCYIDFGTLGFRTKVLKQAEVVSLSKRYV